VLCAVGAAVAGYRLGLLARVASWIGMAGGFLLAGIVLPGLLRSLQGAGSTQLLLVTIGLLLGSAFLGQAVGLMTGSRLHATLPGTAVRSVDRVAGAAAGVVGLLVAVWVLLPLMADVRGWLAAQARGSQVAAWVQDRLPDPPDTVDTLRRLVGEDQFGRVFTDVLASAPDLGPPPSVSTVPQSVVDAVVPSTVEVEGQACQRVQQGSGFVVGPDLVVTNAHVVAGEEETVVRRSDGSEVLARAVAFDPRRDLAVLRAPGLDRPALPLGDVDEGGEGAVFGHPGGGPLRAAPFAVGEQVTAQGTDIYDRGPTRRAVLVLAASLQPGDSGAALVDAAGEVVGIAFAIAPDDPDVAYALAVEELEAVLAAGLSGPVGTGPCL
jgi:S1-C subfamily serine protease